MRINTNTLFWFDKLAENYRIIAPDYLGHPGLSEEKVLNSNNDDYANWIVEIMDNLKLEKVHVIGPSFGGGVALNFAKYYPNKTEKMILIACENDIFFPSKKIIPQSQKIFVNLKKTKEIKNSGHSMNKDDLKLCIDEMISFLGD